jgi:hypothetical protein
VEGVLGEDLSRCARTTIIGSDIAFSCVRGSPLKWTHRWRRRIRNPCPSWTGSVLLRYGNAAGGEGDRRLAAKFLEKKFV